MADHALQLSLPARPENVIVVRQAVAGLGEALGLSDRRVDDLKTVISEACNNVVVHAYPDQPGPLEVSAEPGADELVVTVSDRGEGFQPEASPGEASLGLGLPLIASLSDAFEISGHAGEGTATKICFSFDEEPNIPGEGTAVTVTAEELAMEVAPGEMGRSVLARVIGALAARAKFSVERLSDTVLLGDAVSAHAPEDFPEGLVCISIRDADGTLDVRVGPMVKGGGERILSEMDLPGEGSLKALAHKMDVVHEERGEYLVFEVSS
ncbi:hypothetical protein BH20ACT15_BH20ACT15_05520 [soil metagenome]